MMIYDERETRAEVCEECEHLLRAMPLTCSLVKRQKQIGPMPCPHALRAMLYDAEAVCPHPDAAWAARWRAAEVLQSADVLQSAETAQAETDQAATLTAPTQVTGSSCAAKTAARAVNSEAINQRARERHRRRRGTRHEAFYVQKHPARPVADT